MTCYIIQYNHISVSLNITKNNKVTMQLCIKKYKNSFRKHKTLDKNKMKNKR